MITADINWLTSFDGHKIPYRHWPLENAKAVIHIVHGMSEHSGCYQDVAEVLNANHYAVIAHDHRCHGHSVAVEKLGDISDTQHWRGIHADMLAVNELAKQNYPDLPLIVLAHSMGSFIAQNFAQAHGDKLDMLALEGSSYEPPWFTWMASKLASVTCKLQGENGRSALLHKMTFGGFNEIFSPTQTDFDWISRNTDFVNLYANDSLCGFQVSNAYWRDSLSLLTKIYSRGALSKLPKSLPLYIFSGDRDPVGHDGRSVKKLADSYYKCAGSQDLSLKLYPSARHDLLHETNASEIIGDLLAWIDSRLLALL